MTKPKTIPKGATFYHVTWYTESGDSGSRFYRSKPTKKFLDAFMRENYPAEFIALDKDGYELYGEEDMKRAVDKYRLIFWYIDKVKFED
jgi:hypothetical protein